MIAQEILTSLRKRLLDYDPDVVEVILFGSSVYAPELAQDLDLLIFTAQEKERFGYWDAVGGLPVGVDVVVKQVGETLKGDFAWHVLGAHEVLYGDGTYLAQAASALDDPPFDEAWAAVETARKYAEDAEEASSEVLKDAHIKDAFNKLFHAARLAAMAYLGTEEKRWGKMRRMLPPDLGAKFKEFIETLHVEYFYEGTYPRESVREEFEVWAGKVEDYVKRLEEATEVG